MDNVKVPDASPLPPPPAAPAYNSGSGMPITTLSRPSSSSGRSTDVSLPLDAAAALAGVHSSDDERGVDRASHGRRRSSLMKDVDIGGSTSSRTSPKGGSLKDADNIAEESKNRTRETEMIANDEDEDEDDDADCSEEEGLQDDEETGLTGKDKSRRRRKRRRHTQLDGRIMEDVKITAEEKKLADQNVLKNSLINGLLILSWYIFSLSISIYNKWMFSPEHLDFHFPLFTTCVHMLVQFSLSSLVLLLLPHLRPRYDSISNPHSKYADGELMQHAEDSKKPLMTKTFYLTRIGPCGTATGLDIGLGNMSLKFITLTFYTMCKSSSLAFVLMFAFAFRLETPSWRLVAIIATMTGGVIMMVAGEVAFSTVGFILVIAAAFFSGFRWGLTQILLLRNPATSNPFSSIFYLAPVMFVSLLVIAIPVEGFSALWNGLGILVVKKGPILGPLILIFPGCIAFCMTASEFALLQRTSVVTLSIAGIFKEVVTISAAGIVFHDPLTPINISGLVVTIGAIAAYNWIKIQKMRQDAQFAAHEQHHGEGEADDDEVDGEGEDWNTIEGSHVTADGDIIPNTSYKRKRSKKGESSTTSSGPVGTPVSGSERLLAKEAE